MESDKIRDAILSKAKQEAEGIINDAQAKAQEIIAHAQEMKKLRFEEEKRKILSEAKRESEKLLAKGLVDARLEILKNKDILLNQVISEVKNHLSSNTTNEETWIHLIDETLEAMSTDHDLRVYVSQKDLKDIQKIISGDERFKKQIKEILEVKCLGGLVGEDAEGLVSVDNTYDTRLEMLLAKILPEIGNKLFGAETQ